MHAAGSLRDKQQVPRVEQRRVDEAPEPQHELHLCAVCWWAAGEHSMFGVGHGCNKEGTV